MQQQPWAFSRWGLCAASMIVAFLCCSSVALAQQEPQAEDSKAYRVTVFAADLERPWGMAFLPDGQLLVTEKDGRLTLFAANGKTRQAISGVPQVRSDGQAGLLDVALDPDFASNNYIYLSYAEEDPANRDLAGTAVARAKLVETDLQDLQVIWRQQPKVEGDNHWGSRLVPVAPDLLFITTGDRYSYRDQAQDLSTHFGKTIRIHTDGTVPKDNPFVGRKGALPDIWSYGHRNMQGATLSPKAKSLWTTEHGARGGDELNIDRAGANYGWPVITWGRDYSGLKIGEGTSKRGMAQPVVHWTPSIAPSGLMFYTGQAFPQWQGQLFVGSLKFGYLARLTLEGNKVVQQTKMLEDIGDRVRDVEQGPDGLIYVATDEAYGRILRLEPK